MSAKALTVLNPTRALASYVSPLIESFAPKGIFAVATPQLAASLCDLSTHFSKSSIQLVGAAVDAIPPADQRNAISFLLTKSNLTLHDYVESSPSGVQSSSPASGGLVSSRQNWAMPQSYLSFNVPHASGKKADSVTLPIASTLFTTGSESTMFFQDPMSHLTFVNSLSLSLPSDVCFSAFHNKSPLTKVGVPLSITGVAKNMIKSLDNKPAASFLENAPEIMEYDPSAAASPGDRKVFAQSLLTNDRFEVIAGGGGTWSPRSAMLVLEPRANLQLGDKIQFLVTSPAPSEYSQSEFLCRDSFSSPTLALECVALQESYQHKSVLAMKQDTLLDNVFGLASEQGFLVGDRKHGVPGEIVWATS